MALQGALHGQLPGKKVVSGIAAVTTNVAVDLSADLASIDDFSVSYGEAQAAGNVLVFAAISGTTLTITCLELDFTPGTTEADIHWIAIGNAPR